MSERKQPDTSLAAYDSMKGEPISNHHKRILDVLAAKETATYEEIFKAGGFADKSQVGRRVSELEVQQKIYRTGIKRKTSSNRDAYAYALTGSGIPKAEDTTKPKRKAKSDAPDKKTITVREHTRQLKKEHSTPLMNPLF